MSKRVGIACGGGGELAVAFVSGCVAAVYESTGWDPGRCEVVVGTSGGSITATAMRLGLHPLDYHRAMMGETLSALAREHLNAGVMGAHGNEANEVPALAQHALTDARLNSPGMLLHAVRHPLSWNPVTLAASLLPEGRLSHDFVRNKIVAMTDNVWPEPDLRLTATALAGGQRTVFSRKGDISVDVATAAAASCAVPGVFDPVTVQGEKYVDGGLASSTNADLMLHLDLDAVLIFAPMSTHSKLDGRALMPMRIECRESALHEERQLRDVGIKTLTFHPDHATIAAMGLNLMDVTRRGTVSTAARRAGKALLNSPDGLDMRRFLSA